MEEVKLVLLMLYYRLIVETNRLDITKLVMTILDEMRNLKRFLSLQDSTF